MAGDPFTAEMQAAVINGVNVEFTDAAQKRKLTLILNKLKKIPTGQKALADLAEHKTVVSLDNISAWGAFMPKNNRIVLWGSASNTKLFSVLVHEARHMYQHQNGAGQYKRNDLDIQSQIMLDRAKEADAQTAALTACFEWAAAGDQKPFQAFCDKTPIIYNSYFFNRKNRSLKTERIKPKPRFSKHGMNRTISCVFTKTAIWESRRCGNWPIAWKRPNFRRLYESRTASKFNAPSGD